MFMRNVYQQTANEMNSDNQWSKQAQSANISFLYTVYIYIDLAAKAGVRQLCWRNIGVQKLESVLPWDQLWL